MKIELITITKILFLDSLWKRDGGRTRKWSIHGKSTKGNNYSATYTNEEEKTVGRFAICYRGCDVK